MLKNKLFISLLTLVLLCQQGFCLAEVVNDEKEKITNEISKEEYPASEDVEPVLSKDSENRVIVGGVEEVMDITLEECLRCALGNNPRIQAAMQDVFASDARIRQAWASYFP